MPEIKNTKAQLSRPVPFLPLGKVAEICNGKTDRHLAEGSVPVYGSGGIMRYVNKAANSGPAVLVPRKGSLANITYVDGPFWTVDTVFYTLAKDIIRPKFLYYYLLTQHIEDLNQAGGVPSLTQATLKRIRIPVPSLRVQEEIVRILDSFTSLEAELETELETRQLQYAYYRNLIFKRQCPTNTISLGEITDIKSGESISKKIIQSHPGKYPVINSGKKPLGFINSFNTDNDPIGITSRGANVGSITWCSGQYFRGNLNYSVKIRDSALLSTRYLYHLLQYLQPQIRQLCSYSGIPALNKTKLEELKIPLSNINQQQQIAYSLDQFSLMTQSSTIGLQAEIEARHEQCEYYRNRLLTFKELDHE